MEEIKPRLKLITRRDFDFVKQKYAYEDTESKKNIEEKIYSAKPLDVLALTVMPGSGLKILGVKILNEKKESDFIDLLKTGSTI